MSPRLYVMMIVLVALSAAAATIWALNTGSLAYAIPLGLAAVVALRIFLKRR